MTCSTLRELVTFAYPRQDGRLRFDSDITGGPPWVNADHFDFIAKIPEGAGLGFDAGNTGGAAATSSQVSAIDQVRTMVRALLADRFKLTVHNELWELAVYELRIDRTDGKPGPQFKKVDGPCTAQRGSPCGGFRTMGPGHIVGRAVTPSLLALFLEAPVSRRVFDRTGLPGTFDTDLEYAPANDPSGVSVFTAVREQLGLRLESTKAPVDVLVIDRAEKPTPD